MDIYFPDEPPTFEGAPPAVYFLVMVDGAAVRCAVSAEALEDHFHALGSHEAEMLASFMQGKRRIYRVCRVALERNAGRPVLLRSGLFRFASAAGHI